MTSNVYTVNWIKPKHRFITYNEYGQELLHLSSRFGFTDFSKDIDEVNCLLSCDVMYVDKDGKNHRVPRNKRIKFVGRELVIYNDDNSIMFDEWVYIDVSKPNHIIYDINGNELKIGG